jgi:phage shock protein B
MNELLLILIFVPIFIFVGLVAPIWLVLHYRSRKQVGQGLTERETLELQQLAHSAEKMSQRILTLEKILDHETPEWRSRHDQ